MKIDLCQFGGSALNRDIDVPKDRDQQEMSTGIPSHLRPCAKHDFSFVRSRLCGGHGLRRSIFIGVNAIDYSGYPDCRPEYIRALKPWRTWQPKRASRARPDFEIHTPLSQHDQSGYRA